MPALDWHDLLAAVALYLVIEGLMPAIAPSRFRQTLQSLSQTDERVLRMIGVASMIAGALLLTQVRG